MQRQPLPPDRKPWRLAPAAPVFALLALAGCASGPADIVETRYLCENGVGFTVAFDRGRERATVTFPSLRPLVLAQRRSGSGFRYSDRRRELRGKGDEALWIESDGTELRCTAQPRPR